jgi:hypothetical protein
MVARFIDDAIALRSDAIVVDRVSQPHDLFSAAALTRTDVVLITANHEQVESLVDRVLLSTGVHAVLRLSISGDALTVYQRQAQPRHVVARTASQIVDEAVAIAGTGTDINRDHGKP